MDSNNSFFVSSGFCIPNFYILLTWYIDPLIKWLNHNFLMDLGLLVSAMGFSSISHSICSLCLLILLSCVCFSDGWFDIGQMIWKISVFLVSSTPNKPLRHPIMLMDDSKHLMADLEWDEWFLLLFINLADFV